VADVAWGHAEETHRARVDGRRAVFVTVQQKAGENVFEVRDRVLAEVEALRPTLPAGIALEIVFDQSLQVGHRLSGLTRDFALAIGLVLITLLPLGFRAALIVMVSIPLSLAIGVALLHATGYSINQLSIVGFVIALGLLVDDSIVVTENLTRFLRFDTRGCALRGGDPPDRHRGGRLHRHADARVPAAAALPGDAGVHPQPAASRCSSQARRWWCR
jgi:multidrug efflux pump subunit AcrB